MQTLCFSSRIKQKKKVETNFLLFSLSLSLFSTTINESKTESIEIYVYYSQRNNVYIYFSSYSLSLVLNLISKSIEFKSEHTLVKSESFASSVCISRWLCSISICNWKENKWNSFNKKQLTLASVSSLSAASTVYCLSAWTFRASLSISFKSRRRSSFFNRSSNCLFVRSRLRSVSSWRRRSNPRLTSCKYSI